MSKPTKRHKIRDAEHALQKQKREKQKREKRMRKNARRAAKRSS